MDSARRGWGLDVGERTHMSSLRFGRWKQVPVPDAQVLLRCIRCEIAEFRCRHSTRRLRKSEALPKRGRAHDCFCVDLLHCPDCQVALSQRLVQARVRVPQHARFLHVVWFQFSVPIALHVQHLPADPMLSGDVYNWRLVSFAQDIDYPVLGESCLAHMLLAKLAGAVFATFGRPGNCRAGRAGCAEHIKPRTTSPGRARQSWRHRRHGLPRQ